MSTRKNESTEGLPKVATESPTLGRRVINRTENGEIERDRAASLNDLSPGSQDLTFTDPKIVQAAYEQMSAKERKLYDQYNKTTIR